MTERAGLRFRRLAALVLPLVVLCHFGLVALTIVAPGLVPTAAQPIVEAYLVPFFNQDWRLFSPRPDVHDYAAFARGGFRSGERLESTPWLDLFEPLVVAVQANRLSPDGVRLEILHKTTLFTILAASPFGEVRLGREAIVEHWATIEHQPASLIVLERLASVALREAHPGRSFETVQVMVTSRLVGSGADGRGASGSAALLFHPVPFQDVTTR
jgi:hypothetical protein